MILQLLCLDSVSGPLNLTIKFNSLAHCVKTLHNLGLLVCVWGLVTYPPFSPALTCWYPCIFLKASHFHSGPLCILFPLPGMQFSHFMLFLSLDSDIIFCRKCFLLVTLPSFLSSLNLQMCCLSLALLFLYNTSHCFDAISALGCRTANPVRTEKVYRFLSLPGMGLLPRYLFGSQYVFIKWVKNKWIENSVLKGSY